MKKYNNKRAVFIFMAPAVILFTLVVIYPLLKTLLMSFYDWNGLTAIKDTKFIGLANFKKMFRDDIFYVSLVNGGIYAVVLTGFQLILATFFALTMLDKNIFGKKFITKVYFIPVVLSITVVCQLWLSMYNPSYGLFNKLFEMLGIPYTQNWLSSTGKSSIVAIAMVSAWSGMGYQFFLLYTAAKTIPSCYYEAAQIDGASKWKTHLKITIPLMQENYKVSLVFCINAGLNAFATNQIMTNGGPGTSTYSLSFFMYRSAFKLQKYGYGCAAAVFLVLQCLLVTFILNKVMARDQITY